MKTNHITTCILTALFLTNCATPEEKGWHRPAKTGERIGQIGEVNGSTVTFVIIETCEVHVGDVLSVKRIYCEPKAGQKDTKSCNAFESGTITVQSINANDHTVTAHLREGSVVVDSPIFMMAQTHEEELH